MNIKSIIKQNILRNELLWKAAHVFKPSWSRLNLTGLYEYAKNNGGLIEVIDGQTKRLWPIAPKTIQEFEGGFEREYIERDISKIYTSIIYDAYMQGETDGIIKDDKYIFSRYEWDEGGYTVFNPDSVKAINSKQCIIAFDYKVSRIVDKCICVINKWSSGIVHLAFECLAGMQFIENNPLYSDWPIVIDSIVRKDQRSLDLVKKIVGNREIIWIDKGEIIYSKEIIKLPELVWGTYNLKLLNTEQHAWINDSRAMYYVRNKVLDGFKAKKHYHNVYVTRGNNKRVVNEDEVCSFFKKNGFEIFNPDDGSLYDEVECFATADNIVIGAGSANFNLIYCKNSVNIFSLYPFQYRADAQYMFIDIMHFNVKFFAIDTIENGDTMNHSKFHCPLSKCEAILSETGGSYQ